MIATYKVHEASLGSGVTVRRALPNRALRRIGAWCFLDHAGPINTQHTPLDVGPHPHIGLQTFTWMIQGEQLHLDSLGSHQVVRAKQVNLMTAGYGIAHSETSDANTAVLEAVQLWIALPKAYANVAPRFEHFPCLPEQQKDGVSYTVMMGEFLGMTSPVPSYSPLLGVEVQAQQSTTVQLPLDAEFEHGVLLLAGRATIAESVVGTEQLLYLPTGETSLTLTLQAGARLLLLGGAPFNESIAIWWNFVAHDYETLEQAYQDWIHNNPRFAAVEGYAGPRLSAPLLPARLRFS